MATKNWSETEIKNMIKHIVKQELDDIKSDIADIKKEHKKLTDEEKVKQIVRDTIVNMYKYLWQKSGTYIKQI